MSREEIKSMFDKLQNSKDWQDFWREYAPDGTYVVHDDVLESKVADLMEETRIAALKEVMEWIAEGEYMPLADSSWTERDMRSYNQALTDLNHHLTQMLGDNPQ